MKIENGVVKNVAIFESEISLFDGYILCPDGVGMYYTDNGDGTFSPPA